jgi:hypothetical protein
MYRSNRGCSFFFVQISIFVERYKVLNESEVSEDEVSAGVHKLNAFGPFATMDTLTNGDLEKHDRYWKLPAELIYKKLAYDKVVRRFQTDLQKIKTLKENAKRKRSSR